MIPSQSHGLSHLFAPAVVLFSLWRYLSDGFPIVSDSDLIQAAWAAALMDKSPSRQAWLSPILCSSIIPPLDMKNNCGMMVSVVDCLTDEHLMGALIRRIVVALWLMGDCNIVDPDQIVIVSADRFSFTYHLKKHERPVIKDCGPQGKWWDVFKVGQYFLWHLIDFAPQSPYLSS